MHLCELITKSLILLTMCMWVKREVIGIEMGVIESKKKGMERVGKQ